MIHETKSKGRPVLVTTEYRGVFFGYFVSENKEQRRIVLKGARNCIYWPPSNNGFLGLASDGPLNGAKIGPRADIELTGVTCVAECTPEAVKLWEK